MVFDDDKEILHTQNAVRYNVADVSKDILPFTCALLTAIEKDDNNYWETADQPRSLRLLTAAAVYYEATRNCKKYAPRNLVRCLPVSVWSTFMYHPALMMHQYANRGYVCELDYESYYTSKLMDEHKPFSPVLDIVERHLFKCKNFYFFLFCNWNTTTYIQLMLDNIFRDLFRK